MWLYSLLLWVLVSPRAIYGSDCLVETLKCSRFRPVLHTHKELLTTRTQMNKMCRQQDQFFECLDHMVASKEMDGAIIPSTLQHSRTLINDLCSNTSPWQNLYFDVAACINRQYTEFCVSPEFLRRVVSADKPRSICSLREEAVNCIAATLSMNCGLEAGKLFHHLLRMAKDGSKDCYAIGSETLSFPTLREARCNENLEACKEVFDNFMKRISNIEKQDESVEDLLPVSVQVLDKEAASVSETNSTSSSREELPPTPISKDSSEPFGALDTIAKLKRLGIISSDKSNESMKRNIRSIIRYHGNNSISRYVFLGPSSRELIFCKNEFQDGRKMFTCLIVFRETSPVCLEGGRNLIQTGIPINPEDIDPELGARFYEMNPYSYHFRSHEEMYERMDKRSRDSKNLFNFRHASLQTDTDDSVTAIDSATQNVLDLYRRLYEKYTTDSPAVQALDSINTVSESLDYSNVQDEEMYAHYSSSTSEESDLWSEYVRLATTSKPRMKAETTDDTSDTVMSSGTDSPTTTFHSMPFSGEQEKLLEILAEETEWIFTTALKSKPKEDKLSSNALLLTINGRENSQLVNFTCARVNECHPNATNIEKCRYYFTSDNKGPIEETSQIRHRSPRKASNDREHIDTNGIQLEVEKVSDIMENIPVIIIDESYEQPLDFPDGEPENAHFGRNLEKHEVAYKIRKSAPVQFYDHETLDSVPFVNSEQSLQEKADASVDNEYSSEEFDLISDDSNLRSGSFGETSREILSLLESLKELESRIASLKSIGID